MLYQDIPRIYTAIAEWGACLVYLYMLKREKMKSAHFLIGVLLMLALQCAFLVATGNVSEVLWIPCMIIAVAIMCVFLMVGGSMKPLGAGYCCARAFVLAEFVASLQWQIVSIVQVRGIQSFWTEILITIIIFGGCFVIDIYLERDYLKQDYLQQMTVKEVVAAAIMAVTIFAFSNLSFLSENVPFASKERADIFSMRTLIDFGGIAKGYTGQKLAELFQEYGVSSALVSLGGNIQAIGTKPDGSSWKVEIRDPKGGQQDYIGVLFVENQAVVTSGGYERYFEEDGKTYIHIINPRTGYPADGDLLSVTIVSRDGTLADGMSTALYIMGYEKACQFWRQHREEFNVILVTDDGKIHISENLKENFQTECDLEMIESGSE